MKRSYGYTLVLLLALPWSSPAWAQSSSLSKRAAEANQRPSNPAVGVTREQSEVLGNPVLERNSLIAIKVEPPKTFKVNDLITIIVRQQKKFEADSDLESKKDFDIKSELEAFFKPVEGGLGSAIFRRGKPNVDYKFGMQTKNEGDTTREDSFITRVTGRIIDVKPNGNLIVEATYWFKHDEEVNEVTLTGECRSDDVTPDNTVLSTQVADLRIDVKNSGAVKDASSRGWIPKLLDTVKPF